MEKLHGIAVPHQLQLGREFLIPFPELQQHREKVRNRDLVGNIRPDPSGFRNAAQGLAGGTEFFGVPVKKSSVFFGKRSGVRDSGDHKGTHGAPLVVQRRGIGALMIAQQIVNGHHGSEIPAFFPAVRAPFVNLPGNPADPEGGIQVGQENVVFIRFQAVLPDQLLLVIFQKDPPPDIHLGIVVGAGHFLFHRSSRCHTLPADPYFSASRASASALVSSPLLYPAMIWTSFVLSL